MSRKYNSSARLKIVAMAIDTSIEYTGKHYGISRQAVHEIFKKDGHRCLYNPDAGKGKSYREIQNMRWDELYKRLYEGQVVKNGRVEY